MSDFDDEKDYDLYQENLKNDLREVISKLSDKIGEETKKANKSNNSFAKIFGFRSAKLRDLDTLKKTLDAIQYSSSINSNDFGVLENLDRAISQQTEELLNRVKIKYNIQTKRHTSENQFSEISIDKLGEYISKVKGNLESLVDSNIKVKLGKELSHLRAKNTKGQFEKQITKSLELIKEIKGQLKDEKDLKDKVKKQLNVLSYIAYDLKNLKTNKSNKITTRNPMMLQNTKMSPEAIGEKVGEIMKVKIRESIFNKKVEKPKSLFAARLNFLKKPSSSDRSR